MTVLAKFAAYDREGKRCGGGSLQMPEYLDWMNIEVKAEYFRYIGQGPEAATTVILESQGEERLLHPVLLRQIRHDTYKERYDSAVKHIADFIAEGGYERDPRNQ